MSSERGRGPPRQGSRKREGLFEGRTILAGASRGLPEREALGKTRRDRKDLGVERWREASRSGDIGGERSAGLGSHRVEESKGGGLEESLQCHLKCRNPQQRAGTLMASELMGDEGTAGSGMPGPGGGECEGRRKGTQGGVYRCVLICNMGIKGSDLMERCRD